MGRAILSVLIIILSLNFSHAQKFSDGKMITGLSLNYLNYRSFSQQKTNLKMHSGYPVLISNIPAASFHLHFNKSKSSHNIDWRINLPAGLTSDNGTGMNFLLNEDKSNYFRSSLGYRLTWPLLNFSWLELRHGFVTGLQFEKRKLTYLSGSIEKTTDINAYLGPALKAEIPVNRNIGFFGNFDGQFYLPYLNYGKIKSYNYLGSLTYSDHYFGFYYQARFIAGLNFFLENTRKISLGIEKNDIVGFAGPSPSFKAENIIHYKLDRLLGIFLSVTF